MMIAISMSGRCHCSTILKDQLKQLEKKIRLPEVSIKTSYSFGFRTPTSIITINHNYTPIEAYEKNRQAPHSPRMKTASLCQTILIPS
jgi:hypothetical protein